MTGKDEGTTTAIRESHTDEVGLMLVFGRRIKSGLEREQMAFHNETKLAEHMPRKETRISLACAETTHRLTPLRRAGGELQDR